MKLKSIAPWFGGKRTMADQIVEQLGRHAAFWEPFCGSCAVLMAKEPSSQETVNDLHGDIVNLAMVIASDRWCELKERVARVHYCEELFHEFKYRFKLHEADPPAAPAGVQDRHVLRAALFFVVSWMGRNGVAGTARVNYQIALRWTPGGGSGPVRFVAAVDSIEAWHERLKNVVILRREAFSFIPKIDDAPNVAIYCDPPYLTPTRGTGGSKYEHDFDQFVDFCENPRDSTCPIVKIDKHELLARHLGRFQKARVVVSYYMHDRLATLYPPDRWKMIDCSRQKNLHVQNRRGAGALTAPEVLLVNGEIYGE